LIKKLSTFFLLLSIFFCLITFCKQNSQFSSLPKSKKPNLIWIVIDSLRGDVIGKYGVTPVLDNFSKESYVFTDHLVNAAWTRPSTLVFFTGKYASRNPVNFWDYPAPKEEVQAFYEKESFPLPKYLRKNKIHTVMVGNNPFLTDKHGLGVDVGFQDLYDYSNYGNDTPLITKKSLEILEKFSKPKNKDNPFFLFINFNDPHKPYTPPNGYAERVKFDPNMDERKRNYLGEVAYIDDQLKNIFQYLKETNLWDDTTIIITADHGEVMLADHAISPFTGTNTYYGHGQDLFLENIHVPLIVKKAHQKIGKIINTRTQSVDLYPFVLEEFGLDKKSQLDGVSLMDTIQGNVSQKRLYYGETRSTQAIGLGSDFLLQKSFRFHELGKFWEGYVGREIYYYFDIKKDPLQIFPIRFESLSELEKINSISKEREKIKLLFKNLREIEPPLPSYTIRFNQLKSLNHTLEAKVTVTTGELRLKDGENTNIKFILSPRQITASIEKNKITSNESSEFSFEVYPDVSFPKIQLFKDGIQLDEENLGIGMFDLSPKGCSMNCMGLYEAPILPPKNSLSNHFQIWIRGGAVKNYQRTELLETDALEILKKQGYVQ